MTAGDDVVRAGPAGLLHHAWRGERLGRVTHLGWGQAASAGPRWAAPEWGGNGWLLGQARLSAGFRPTVSFVI
jgi:hypothetical protein